MLKQSIKEKKVHSKADICKCQKLLALNREESRYCPNAWHGNERTLIVWGSLFRCQMLILHFFSHLPI